jgi:hypothetical protein
MADEKKRMYLELPVELAEQIESVAGPRRRNDFIAAVLELEFRRRRLVTEKSQQIQVHEANDRRWVN